MSEKGEGGPKKRSEADIPAPKSPTLPKPSPKTLALPVTVKAVSDRIHKASAASVPARADLPVAPRRAKTKAKAAEFHDVEIAIFNLYDIGRAVDLKKVASMVPANPDIGIVKRRDTPSSLKLPRPLILQLGKQERLEAGPFDSLIAVAKIYDEGAVTIVVRLKARVPLDRLHSLPREEFNMGSGMTTVERYVAESFERLFENIKSAVTFEEYVFEKFERESYAAYCVLDIEENPASWVGENAPYLTALLIGEDPAASLHPSQAAHTLETPFCYRENDLAIFDMDRCLIVDRSRDYEDLLVIAEHANYQLLELRQLDKLLDRWLDEAEKDVRAAYTGHKRRARARALPLKFANIQALRFDALFILENLENNSKIIGDYYLGQIYDHLCSIFNTEGWKWSVERRLETLQNIYELVKGDTNEKTMVQLEIAFILVCVFQIIQTFVLFWPT